MYFPTYQGSKKDQRIDTAGAFFLRYYVTTTDKTGASVGKQECVKLADKGALYRSWADVEPLIARLLENVNKDADIPTRQMPSDVFVTKQYFPWAEKNKAAATANACKRV